MSESIHTIRLHGPWLLRQVMGEREIATAKLKLPGTIDEDIVLDNATEIELTRKFNCPTGLENDQVVWVHISNITTVAEVFLNDTSLGKIAANSALRTQINTVIQPHNRLTLRVSTINKNGSLSVDGPVQLEIAQT